MMGLVKAFLVIPAAVSGFYLVNAPAGHEGRAATLASAKVSAKKVRTLEEQVVSRRVRIERVLSTLERIAQATEQMSPERAARLEPALASMAEDTLELAGDEAVMASATDDRLDKIEGTLADLVDVLSRSVEPEMSL